jgi:electron transfer flavoprotein alpha subunit
VWVFIEHDRGAVHPVSWELLGEGRKLADKLGVDLAGVLLGAPDEAGGFCAEADPAMAPTFCYWCATRCWQGLPQRALHQGPDRPGQPHQPEIMLLGATTMGRDLAGSVATTLGTGPDRRLHRSEHRRPKNALAATRPTFGGSLLCTIMTLAYRPQMATVRPRVMRMPRRDSSRSGPVVEHPLGMVETDIVTKLLDFIPDATRNTVNLPLPTSSSPAARV